MISSKHLPGVAVLLLLACKAPEELEPDSGPPDLGADVADQGVVDGRRPVDAGASTANRAVIDKLAQPILDGKWVVGLVVGVVTEKGTEVYGYGTTKLGGGQVPDESTVFEIGSITKTFTSLILAQQIEKQVVTLDQPVQQLLGSAVTVPRWSGKSILLKHLSTHTSGLPRMPTNFKPTDPANPYVDYGADKLYAFLQSYVLTVEPGTKWAYSNLGAALLGHALTLKVGTPYEELVKSTILSPLAMSDTTIKLSPDQSARFAQGYTDELVASPAWDLNVFAPAGALRSTVRDLLKYLAVQAGRQSSPLSSAIALTHAPVFKISATTSMGLGWLIDGGRFLFHDGGTGGFSSFAGFDSQKKNLVVVLGNTTTRQAPVVLLGQKLLKVLDGEAPTPLDLPPTLWLPEASLEPFCGTYQLQGVPAYKLTISRKGDALYVALPQEGPYRIWPQSAEKFYSRLAPFWVTFSKGTSGGWDSLLFEQTGLPSHIYTRVP